MEPTNIVAIAAAAHMVNRAYCQGIGDNSQPAWNDAPEWQCQSAILGVQGIVAGRINSPEESHAGWLAHKRMEGWEWGAEKDVEKKLHPCMVPYDQLPEAQRQKDVLFFETVRTLSSLLGVS